jgi:hypothetical protein
VDGAEQISAKRKRDQMAKDMVCKLCESSEEPEVGVMLVSDLTGSGQLPFAVGLNCMTDFLTGLLETFAQPEGITPPEPSELEEEDERDRFDGMESTDIGDILADEEDMTSDWKTAPADVIAGGPGDGSAYEVDAEDPLATTGALETNTGISTTPGSAEGPTAILEPSGPSPAESSAPLTGNGKRKTSAKARTAAAETTA